MSNAEQIAKTYLNLSEDSRMQITQLKAGDTSHAAAFILAKEGGLNNAKAWLLPGATRDEQKPLPNVVIRGNVSTAMTLNPDFAQVTLGYEFAANVPLGAPPSTTPIVWTRGLRSDGAWAPDSPWQGKGGHIAFMDGHVRWFDKLSTASGEDSLVKYGTTTPTANIREALPPGAVILSAVPKQAAGR